MPSDPKRVHQAYLHIQLIKAGNYPQVVGSPDERDGGYKIVERPWKEVPEASKLAILQQAVDWSGITSRDQVGILLSHIDFSQLTRFQRDYLIHMEGISERHEEQEAAWEQMLDRIARTGRGKGEDRDIER